MLYIDSRAAETLCDLHHPANLPTGERQWQRNHVLSRSHLLLHSTVHGDPLQCRHELFNIAGEAQTHS
jgi:hypothetical protein